MGSEMCIRDILCALSVVPLMLSGKTAPSHGGPAWLLSVVWPGPCRPCGATARGRTHLLGLRRRTRSLHHRLFHGDWWGALGGGAEGEGSRRGALHRDQV